MVLLICLVAFPRTEEGENFKLTLTGSKTWTLSYGIGDASGLAKFGASAYQIYLDQSLAVDIEGEALSVLTINAHFNDQESASMQKLTIRLDTDHVKGILGDFSLTGQQSFAVYNKKLKGLRLDYLRDDTTLTGIVSQIEGVSESQTFTGNTGHGEVLFAAAYPDTPWISKPYQTNIAGLYAYPLHAPFIEDFSEVYLEFVTSAEMEALLTSYGLEYLYEGIVSSPTTDLSGGSFSVVTDEKEIDNLVLKSEPNALLRNYIMGAISTFNNEHDLFDSDDYKTYPFTSGSDYELGFLSLFAEYVKLKVDDDAYPILETERKRFYYLGKPDVVKDSIFVEVSHDGQIFKDISQPEFASYAVYTYEDEGIVEFDFPSSFFAKTDSAVRVFFDYKISGDVISLGLSVVPESEKVYLNGELLVRDTDYSVDYDTGLLILFTKIGDKDTIRVDYERSRGGLGSSSEYARNLYGAMLRLPVSDSLTLDLSLLQAADTITSAENLEKLHTMPNTHTVSGVAGSIKLEGFNGQFTAGYSNNVFPFDDNLRLNMPNRVSSILVANGYVIFASLNGISVRYEGEWTSYGAASGLSGSCVYAMERYGDQIYFGTSSGLSTVSLLGESPLDKVGNWKGYYTDDGLPNVAVHSLFVNEGILYIGTEGGLAVVPIGSLDDPASYVTYNSDEFSTINALAMSAGKLYVGTDSGLFVLDSDEGVFHQVLATAEDTINALFSTNGVLYVASNNGLGLIEKGGATMGWIYKDGPVYALCLQDGDIYFGTSNGLHNESGVLQATEGITITALGADPNGDLWVGSRADCDYYMRAFVVHDETAKQFDNYDLHLDGRDNNRFKDIPASDHTDEGILLRASFNRNMEHYSLSGSFQSVQPTFTSIGSESRNDSTGWALNGDFEIADGIDLDVSHKYHEIAYASGDPQNEVENQASISLNLGINADLSVSQSLVNNDFFAAGFETTTHAYTLALSDKLLSDSLSVSIGWTDAYYGGNEGGFTLRRNRLSGSIDWNITSTTNLKGNWARPLSFTTTGVSGSENWSLTGSVKHYFTGLSASFVYDVDGTRGLADEITELTQSANVDLRPNAFSLFACRLTPRITLEAGQEAGIITVSGQASLQATVSDFSVNGSVGRDVSGYGEDRQQIKDRISASLAYTGIPDLRPNLAYTQNVSEVTYRGESRGTTTRTLTGSLSWTPPDGSRDTLRVSARSSSGSSKTDDLTLSLNNTYTFSVDPFSQGMLYQPISVRCYADGNYTSNQGKRDVSLSVETSADLTISETWQTSLTGSYLIGTKGTDELYNSLLLELFIAARF
jgi:hypothetical protein